VETGKLLRFNSDKGFGFIGPDAGGPDLFMHASDLDRSSDQNLLVPGETRLCFSRSSSVKGAKASRISIVEAEPREAEQDAGEPVMPTLEAWAALWAEASEAAFDAVMKRARAYGWVRSVLAA
jgi:cold shock CspA family protein